MSEKPVDDEPHSDGEAEQEEQELGEGWVGVTRPGDKPTPPPVADRSGRRQLYTTVLVKEVDAETFSEQAKSNRVWWTPDDDVLPDADDELPFDVDISSHAVAKQYKVGETTRRGDFFVVKSATAPDGKTVSIKAISVGTASMLGQSVDALAKEIDMFRLCGNGAHVCAALALERDDDAICLVLEAVAGAALNVQLARGGENYQVSDARRLVQQCASAVAAVHAAGVVHRDIVPDNFVFTAKDNIDTLKLCDFSFAVKTDGALSDAPGGDPEFQAPELARDESHGAACDVWSLGALAHLLLSGQPPLHDGNTTRLQMKIGKGDLNLGNKDVWPAQAPANALDFVKSLLATDAAKRPSAAEVAKLPFLTAKDDALLPTFKASLKQWNETR